MSPAKTAIALIIFLAAMSAHALLEKQPVTASAAWVKAPTSGSDTAEAFVVVSNPTMYDVYLVSVAADLAGEATFRQAQPGGAGSAEVKEVTAPAYGKVELTASGAHISLAKLKRPLKAGDTVQLTLTTDSGVALQVAAPVKP